MLLLNQPSSVFFYLSDSIPLIIGFAPYAILWPGNYFERVGSWYAESPGRTYEMPLKDSRSDSLNGQPFQRV